MIKFEIYSVHEIVLILANCKYFKIISGEQGLSASFLQCIFVDIAVHEFQGWYADFTDLGV